MKFDPDLHRRRSIRWKGYDYSQRGTYFVTICAFARKQLFGKVENGTVSLNDAGWLVSQAWLELPNRFPGLQLDASVVMPNHFHGILAILTHPGGSSLRGAASSAPTLGQIIRVFKSLSAIQINRRRGRSGTPVWQRNYYEHVVRDGRELTNIQRYIFENPVRWQFDPENPEASLPEKIPAWL